MNGILDQFYENEQPITAKQDHAQQLLWMKTVDCASWAPTLLYIIPRPWLFLNFKKTIVWTYGFLHLIWGRIGSGSQHDRCSEDAVLVDDVYGSVFSANYKDWNIDFIVGGGNLNN